MKDVVVIGGPNGAGKTTAAPRLLPASLGIREFVNADEIARGLSPFDPESQGFAAGRLMVGRIHSLVRSGESFGFETTCAGIGHGRLLRRCRDAGYRVTLVFLWLPSPEAAVKRVARRVREGGHRIADDVVIRRYRGGLRNLVRLYLPLADIATIYDNSDKAGDVVARKTPGGVLHVLDADRWALIKEPAG